MIDDENFLRLEIMLAHQEKQIQDLSEMVARQWQEIEFLKKSLLKTETRLSEMDLAAQSQGGSTAMSTAEFAASEKPPHY